MARRRRVLAGGLIVFALATLTALGYTSGGSLAANGCPYGYGYGYGYGYCPPANQPPTIKIVGGECQHLSKAKGALAIRLDDPDGDETALTFTATSDNQVLLPNGNIVITGSGANRTVAFTAATGKSGTATLTLTVSDGTDSASLAVTVKVGTSSANTLNGTTGPDVLFGLGGADTLNGLGDTDLLCGHAGNDALNGGDGNDFLDGAGGNDALNGGAGDDRMLGVGGKDTLTGGLGADFFSGGAGADTNTDFNAGQGDTTDGT